MEINRIIILTALCLSFIGCSDKFPTTELYVVDTQKQICDQYAIDQENIEFTFTKNIPYKDCPIVFGFKQKDVGQVMSWIRRMKSKLEGCQ